MTCEGHRELEEERRQARRELEGDPLELPDQVEPASVPNSPYPPAAPVVNEDGTITVPLNLRGGR